VISEPAIVKATPKAHGGFFGIFRPAPPAPVMLTDPAQIAGGYRSWQLRVLVLSILGYATFYFVRNNLPVAMPFLGADLGITKSQLGIFLTLQGVIYGVSKFANGLLADRANAAVFMSTALAASALINLCFGSSSTVLALGVFWMINGWFQGMGFPPCARLMASWFPPKQFATKFSIWNMSHNVGSIGILLLCGFLVSGGLFAANWRLCFFVPAAIAVVMAFVLWFMMPDTPPSVGLPEFEGTHVDLPEKKSHEDFKAFVLQQVFSNPYIWILSMANFFVYILRYAVFNWSPTMLLEVRHIKILRRNRIAHFARADFARSGFVRIENVAGAVARFDGLGHRVFNCVMPPRRSNRSCGAASARRQNLRDGIGQVFPGDVRRGAAGRFVKAETSVAARAEARARQHSQRTAQRRRFVAQNVAEHVFAEQHVELRGLEHELHRAVVHEHVVERDVGIIFADARDDFAPENAVFQHVRLVNARQFFRRNCAALNATCAMRSISGVV
jgi:MFS family permease